MQPEPGAHGRVDLVAPARPQRRLNRPGTARSQRRVSYVHGKSLWVAGGRHARAGGEGIKGGRGWMVWLQGCHPPLPERPVAVAAVLRSRPRARASASRCRTCRTGVVGVIHDSTPDTDRRNTCTRPRRTAGRRSRHAYGGGGRGRARAADEPAGFGFTCRPWMLR